MAETAAVSHIWVVDDDRSVRFVLSTALRDAGYAVDGFDSAAAALQALGMRPTPDLLFTDVRMPGEDGLTLLDKLKSKHPHLPVIVMSAYTDVASTAGAFRGGAHEFLSSRSTWTTRWHWLRARCRTPMPASKKSSPRGWPRARPR